MIIPQPQQIDRRSGAFTIERTTTLTADRDSAAAADALRRALGPATGFELPDGAGGGAGISVRVDAARLGPEAYELDISPDRIELVGGDAAGAFYGVQSLLQLLPPEVAGGRRTDERCEIACARIQDRPRHGWRGTMLDVSRHFMPKDFVLRLIDLLALHKLNVLHLHLTDDQGWRFPVPDYPKLTEVGGQRAETIVGHPRHDGGDHRYDGTPHGGTYSTEDLREIVAYAAARFVTVVPEIDMPGHMQAAVTAYPQLGNTDEPAEVRRGWGISSQILNVDDATLDFCRTLLAEAATVFPAPFVHCGGDEVPKQEWKASAAAQARMRELGLDDEQALQAWFTGEMAAFLASEDRRFVGWDEVLEGTSPEDLPADVVVMSWRSEQGGIEAARAGRDVVMAPCQYVYFDYYQSEDTDNEPLAIGGYVPLEKVYGYEPIPAEIAGDESATGHVLGAQAQLWTEYVPTTEHAEYMLFPRLTAFAEAVWRERPDPAGYAGFLDRLRPHLARLDALGVHYRPLD